MRKSIIILLFLCPTVCFGQIEKIFAEMLADTSSILVDSNIIYTLKINKKNKLGQPDGVWWDIGNNNDTGYFPSVSTYNNGLLDGQSIVFYPNKVIATNAYYSQGQLHGIFISFWPNGKLYKVSFYKMGDLNGLYKEYDSSGTLIKATQFVNNKKNGYEVVFSSKGEVISIKKFFENKEIKENTN